ncbi:Hypothetical protein PHPALM_10388 [Phytophthora palmivora]|uniref:Uncharacterized protein n=1 Tax=Phytophthora palmivora TaxID=4796 RepID=A0A2P4Y4V7_9STRA|nr:Hypothetical protein PHPALM_10388 [Phytophthora palmivora]
MAELGSKDFAERLSFPTSAWALKEITSTKVQIYYREHILGDNIVIPDSIKLNRFIIDFPKTNNNRKTIQPLTDNMSVKVTCNPVTDQVSGNESLADLEY